MAHPKTKNQTDETEGLRREFENLRADFASLARELKAYGRQEERMLGEKANERVATLKSVGERQFETAKSYANDAARTAETTVREHPAYAVAGAAALGFLLGAFTLRRR